MLERGSRGLAGPGGAGEAGKKRASRTSPDTAPAAPAGEFLGFCLRWPKGAPFSPLPGGATGAFWGALGERGEEPGEAGRPGAQWRLMGREPATPHSKPLGGRAQQATTYWDSFTTSSR